MPPAKPTKEAEHKLVCGTCGKEVASGKPRSNVTRFLVWESRCTCIEKDIDEAKIVLKVTPEKHKVGCEPGQADFDKDNVEASLDGKYEVLSLLGRGGMGAVYKVHNKELHKTFAIKILNKDLIASQQSQRRFKQESDAASKLTHPNLVAVYEHGISASGSPYLVMDYLEGTDLARLLTENGALDKDRALPIFAQLADALVHAHEKGVVHRDIKPENVILTHEGNLDIVKIVDFGIAKDITHERATQRLTQTGEIFGSPMYMSPEQCLGNPQDQRSDLYALGCLMYETIVGEPPFAGDNPVSVILKQVTEEPAPPSAKTPPNTVSPSLEAIIMRCLEKEPSARYQSARDLLADIDTVMNGGTVQWKRKKKSSSVASSAKATTIIGTYMLAASLACAVVMWNTAHQTDPELSALQQHTVQELLTLANNAEHGYDNTARDPKKAELYYQTAMDKGSAEAYVRCGFMLDHREYPPKEQPRAMELLRKGFEMGDAQGAGYLGSIYEANRDYNQARHWYQKGVAKGDEDSIDGLANLYENGLGVPQDFKQAAALYEKTASLPVEFTSRQRLGYLYENGLGVPRDYKKALQLYTQAAEQFGEDWAYVGDMYRNGHGVPRDYIKAMEYYHQSTRQSSGHGWRGLGDLYAQGLGVSRDYQMAADNYAQAEFYGDLYAGYRLAKLIDAGKAQPPDGLHPGMYVRQMDQDTRWKDLVDGLKYESARGSAESSYLLGELYRTGDHVPNDVHKAADLYKLAAAKNYEPAIVALKTLGVR